VKAWVAPAGARFRRAYLWFEEKPLVVLIAAAGTTIGVMIVLAEIGGWARVSRVATTRHSWGWLAVCLLGEMVAYGGYILTVRDMARVDRCAEMSVTASAQTVVAGFGIFAATRSSGGFAVDYWAFRKAGATEKEAGARAVGLGLLEYVVLSIAALGASLLLFLRLDGSASAATTLPSLAIVPCLVAGFYVTSPKRARKLARPKGGYVRRWFAAVVAGGVTLRHLPQQPAGTRDGRPR
jgi:hypothetical protein